MMRSGRALMTFLTLGLLAGGAAQAQHATDLWIGRTNDDALAISPLGRVPENVYLTLNPVGGPPLWGWSYNSPGFDHIVNPEPDNDVWPLDSGATIWIEAVALDPAFRLIAPNGTAIVDEAGESLEIGDYLLHRHPIWHINSVDPAYDPGQCVWEASFLLWDAGSTAYADSRLLTFRFTNVPYGPLRNPPVPATGDFDGDTDVDGDDFAALETCHSAPDALTTPNDPAVTTCAVECVNAFDFDEDLDVDLRDVAEFQVAFTGSGG
jgi:hypothetical protein